RSYQDGSDVALADETDFPNVAIPSGDQKVDPEMEKQVAEIHARNLERLKLGFYSQFAQPYLGGPTDLDVYRKKYADGSDVSYGGLPDEEASGYFGRDRAAKDYWFSPTNRDVMQQVPGMDAVTRYDLLDKDMLTLSEKGRQFITNRLLPQLKDRDGYYPSP